MARYEGLASVRRALSMPNGFALLDIKPDALNWQWANVPPARAREAIAVALAAIDGRWKLYISLPDDPNSNTLEIVGLSRTQDVGEPSVLYQGGGIGGFSLTSTVDSIFAYDYNSSGKLDHLVAFRPGTTEVRILRNSGGQFTPVYQGSGIGGFDLWSPFDRGFAFDWNSSGKLDHVAFYRPGDQYFYIGRNNVNVYAGAGYIGGYDLISRADRAFAIDFDSSGKQDHIAIYRPGESYFHILKRNGAVFESILAREGLVSYDLLSPADRLVAIDYNSSGKRDHIMAYRPGRGDCRILRRSGSDYVPIFSEMGIGGYDLAHPNDRVIPFDYNNVGKLDHLVMYRPGTGTIWILKNNGGTFIAVYGPGTGDVGIRGYDLADPRDRVIAFDYNSNGRQDNLLLYRPGAGRVWILNSIN